MKCPHCDFYESNHPDEVIARRAVSIHIAHAHNPNKPKPPRARKILGVRTPPGGFPKTCGLQAPPAASSSPWRKFKLPGSL